jgi:hypothetical protein
VRHTALVMRMGAAATAALALGCAGADSVPAQVRPAPALGDHLSLTPATSSGKLQLSLVHRRRAAGSVVVSNTGRQPVTVRLKAVDVGTSVVGGPTFAKGRPRGAGAWLRLSATRIRLAGRTARRVPFVVTAPAAPPSGEVYAGIVATTDAAATPSAARRRGRGARFELERIVRHAVPVRLRFPGPRPHRLLVGRAHLDVNSAATTMRLAVRHPGGGLVRTTRVDLRVTRDGHTRFADHLTVQAFMPRTATELELPWKGQPKAGDYRLTGWLRPAGGAPIRVGTSLKISDAKVRADRLARPAMARPHAGTGTGTPIVLVVALGLTLALCALLSVSLLRSRRAARR